MNSALARGRSFKFATLFEPGEVAAAFADATAHVFESAELKKFVRDQGDKAQFSATLLQLASGEAVLPPSIAHVVRLLEATARAHLHDVLAQLAPNATAVEDGLERKSVFRIWRYNAGACCRPHYDPGLLTAMLLGSCEGLQLNLTKVLSPVGELLGNYDDGAAVSTASDVVDDTGWVDAGNMRSAATDDVLVIANTTLQLLTNGNVPHVLHRVVHRPLETDEQQCRVNMVLELRPSRSKDWYGLAAHLPNANSSPNISSSP